ncbi:myrosinase 1-like isoform X3 [Odontomachus brunneus]|uniref:myrosinase 1-like isoform X3 n=1 Tax=Odontomachus brunneus TaxID=486640 RepID=UPI0013F23A20|nr:myrosinase 1-like isoform X3 [Odontomachus brunneus]
MLSFYDIFIRRRYWQSVVFMMATSSLRIAAILVVSDILFVTHGLRTNNGRSFPKNFLLGVASSAYQIEGGWNQDGKGVNVWDQWVHDHPDAIYDHSNGDVACDSYNKYKEDVQLLKEIGVDFYRFSLSWSRILPNGYSNVINYDGLNYYKNLIDELLANGIKPFVTIYHWDHPNIFESMGGWTNELMVDWIADYARVVFKELGPKVKYFMTINEPTILCNEAYVTGEWAAGKKLGSTGKFLCLHNILKAHAKIYHIYDEEFRKEQNGQIGIVTCCGGLFAKTPNDTAAVDTAFQFDCGVITSPIYSKTGDYPEVVKHHIAENSKLEGFSKSILPKFSPEWIHYIKGTSDFLGLNHYTSRLVETVPHVNGQAWYEYSGINMTIDPSWPLGGSKWLRVVPDGLQQIITKLTKEYGRVPIYVSENGYSNIYDDINDDNRISYLYSYMDKMLSAIYDDGCNVKGYTVWSLMDNFEWARGYSERFGIVHVNFTDPNRTRTPKSSMKWYKNVIQTRKLHNTSTLTDFEPVVISV